MKMEKCIKILTAVGVILSACGELLKQFNTSQELVKDKVKDALLESTSEEKKE